MWHFALSWLLFFGAIQTNKQLNAMDNNNEAKNGSDMFSKLLGKTAEQKALVVPSVAVVDQTKIVQQNLRLNSPKKENIDNIVVKEELPQSDNEFDTNDRKKWQNLTTTKVKVELSTEENEQKVVMGTTNNLQIINVKAEPQQLLPVTAELTDENGTEVGKTSTAEKDEKAERDQRKFCTPDGKLELFKQYKKLKKHGPFRTDKSILKELKITKRSLIFLKEHFGLGKKRYYNIEEKKYFLRQYYKLKKQNAHRTNESIAAQLKISKSTLDKIRKKDGDFETKFINEEKEKKGFRQYCQYCKMKKRNSKERTDREIAARLNISRRTLGRIKKKYNNYLNNNNNNNNSIEIEHQHCGEMALSRSDEMNEPTKEEGACSPTNNYNNSSAAAAAVDDDDNSDNSSAMHGNEGSQAIDAELRKEAEKNVKVLKVLLLGASNSGKSTVAKQMRILHTEGFSEAEKLHYKYMVHSNYIDFFIQIAKGIVKFGIQVPETERELVQTFEQAYYGQFLNLDQFDDLLELHRPDGIVCIIEPPSSGGILKQKVMSLQDAYASVLDAFCGTTGPFWDPKLMDSPTLPRLSPCLQHSLLVLLPTMFVFLVAAPVTKIQLLMSSGPVQPLPWTYLLSAKFAITWVLVADTVFMFLLAIVDVLLWRLFNPVDFLYPIFLLLSMLILRSLIQACRLHGRITSGPIFLSWFLFGFFGLPELYDWVLTATHPNEMENDRIPRYIAFLIWYPGVITQIVLFSFADTPTQNRYELLDRQISTISSR